MSDWIICRAKDRDAAEMARLYRASFGAKGSEGWDESGFSRLLASQGMFALAAKREGSCELWGFIMLRTAADEVEIVTIAVDPYRARQGIGRALVEEAMRAAAETGALAAFLEVAVDNEPALRLYRTSGFVAVGNRRGYYRREAAQIDAVVMRRDIAST